MRPGESQGSGRCPLASSLLFLPHLGARGRAWAAGSSLRLEKGGGELGISRTEHTAMAWCLFFPQFFSFSLLAESIIKHILSSAVLLENFHLACALVGNEIFRGQNIVIKPRHIFC